MVRLTPDIIARAPERMNPFGERELSLRGKLYMLVFGMLSFVEQTKIEQHF
jgi:hypothetical protein